MIGTLDVTGALFASFSWAYLTKGHAMFLMVLIPLLMTASLIGIFLMMYEDPDRVASNYFPYVEIGK